VQISVQVAKLRDIPSARGQGNHSAGANPTYGDSEWGTHSPAQRRHRQTHKPHKQPPARGDIPPHKPTRDTASCREPPQKATGRTASQYEEGQALQCTVPSQKGAPGKDPKADGQREIREFGKQAPNLGRRAPSPRQGEDTAAVRLFTKHTAARSHGHTRVATSLRCVKVTPQRQGQAHVNECPIQMRVLR